MHMNKIFNIINQKRPINDQPPPPLTTSHPTPEPGGDVEDSDSQWEDRVGHFGERAGSYWQN